MRALARPLATGENALDPWEWPEMLPPRLSREMDRRPPALLSGRVSRCSSLVSWSLQAIALSKRMRLASLTRRRNRGSVVRVRKVSFRILEYAGEAPRWMRAM